MASLEASGWLASPSRLWAWIRSVVAVSRAAFRAIRSSVTSDRAGAAPPSPALDAAPWEGRSMIPWLEAYSTAWRSELSSFSRSWSSRVSRKRRA